MNSDSSCIKKCFRQKAIFELGPEGQIGFFQDRMSKERTHLRSLALKGENGDGSYWSLKENVEKISPQYGENLNIFIAKEQKSK